MIIGLQPQLYIEIVILIVGDAETVSLKHLTVTHAPIAKEHLRTFREPIGVGANDKVELVRELSKRFLPDLLSIVLLHLDLFINRRQFTLCSELIINRLLHLPLELDGVKDLLFNEEIHIIIRINATAIVIVVKLAPALILLRFFLLPSFLIAR